MNSRGTSEGALPENRELVFEKAKHWKVLVPVVLLLSDVLLALAIWRTAYAVQGLLSEAPVLEAASDAVLPSIVAWVGIRALFGFYPGYGLGSVEELRYHTYAVLATIAAVTTLAVSFQVGNLFSRLLLAVGFLGLLLLAPPVRYGVKCTLEKAVLWGKPVVMFGCGETGAQVARVLQENWSLGYKPVAAFDDRQRLVPESGKLEGVPYGGPFSAATTLSREHGVEDAIFAIPHTYHRRLANLISAASEEFRYITVIPNLGGVTNSAAVTRNFSGIFGVEIRYNLLDPWAQRAKRAIDLVATAIGGFLILPLLLVLALLVWLESGGPVFYRDKRMGHDGALFYCVKFRSMVPDAETALQRMLEEDPAAREEYSRYHKLRHDPRVTRVGRLLRKTSLDELPQIWNVLRGEMSLVGPRPYLPRESEKIGSTQREILRVRPGITGPWQVAGRNHAAFEERVATDAHYVHDWSVWLDLVILIRTVRTVLLSRNAY